MFFEKYLRTIKEKKSVININLDPALPTQRCSNVIPDRYISEDNQETILNFSLDLIEQVSDYCCSIKPNMQYYLANTSILKKIVKKTHDEGMLAILDNKLSDIGSTNNAGIYWIKELGFDAFTFSPFAGNIQEATENAHKNNLGIIVLTLMSNPEAEIMMVNTKTDGIPYFLYTAKTIKHTGADGCVVGLTSFVQPEQIKNIQKIVGDSTVFLLQGIGPQGGQTNKIKCVINPLISLGRAVIYSSNPRNSVKKYYEELLKK